MYLSYPLSPFYSNQKQQFKDVRGKCLWASLIYCAQSLRRDIAPRHP